MMWWITKTMQWKIQKFVIVLFVGVLTKRTVSGDITSKEDGTGTISMGPPDLNSEESESLHMPRQLKCDACKIIAHLLGEGFEKAEKKRPAAKKDLPESDMIDAAEAVCYSKFEHFLEPAPGTEIEDVPGVTQSGGKWPVRLHQMCEEYIGDIGEDRIYEAYKKSTRKNNHKLFKKFLCYDSGALAHCTSRNVNIEL